MIDQFPDTTKMVQPTDRQIDRLFWQCEQNPQEYRELIRKFLARWGRPAIEPVPVSERPWDREGWCDAEGRCYGWDGDHWWIVGNPGWANNATITHWLPHWALPVPQQEAE